VTYSLSNYVQRVINRLRAVQTIVSIGSGAHTAFCSVNIAGSSFGGKAVRVSS